jgi:hypothetical protein
MSNRETAIRQVVEHLPWLASFADVRLVPRGKRPPGRDVHSVRIRLGCDTRVGGSGGCLLAQAPTQSPYVPWGTMLPAGTVLRFAAISTGYEDACSWIGPSAPVFVVEGGASDGLSAAIYLDYLDAAAIVEALAIEEIEVSPSKSTGTTTSGAEVGQP